MFKNLGLQAWTIRDFVTDPEFADLSFRRVKELGYTELQTAGDFVGGYALMAELLAKNGLRVVGTHYDYDRILKDPEATVADHRILGTTNIGIGGLPHEARQSVGALRDFVNTFNRAAEQYAKEGFKLTYHNHSFEFVKIDGSKSLMDIFAEEFDPKNISFVFDTCWAATSGSDVTAWMRKLAGRIDILHLKDCAVHIPGSSSRPEFKLSEVGYGNLDWDSILKAAEEIGVKHYVVEQDQDFTETPFNSLRMSAEFLKKYRA